MNETTALIQKAQRHIRSAELLITDGDYEYTFVFESDEVQQLLRNAQAFTDAVSHWLNTNK